MKKSKRRIAPYINSGDWIALSKSQFSNLDIDADQDEDFLIYRICDDLSYLVDSLHRDPASQSGLDLAYNFVRWSIRNTESTRIRECMADYFFSGVLVHSSSKKKCIDYLDWGDVKILCENFTTEPSFEDVDNFDILCEEWKKRWSRNQKLATPQKPAEQDAAGNPLPAE